MSGESSGDEGLKPVTEGGRNASEYCGTRREHSRYWALMQPLCTYAESEAWKAEARLEPFVHVQFPTQRPHILTLCPVALLMRPKHRAPHDD